MNADTKAKVKQALEFYLYEAEAIHRNLESKNPDAALASMAVLKLDAGNRAKAALDLLSKEDEY